MAVRVNSTLEIEAILLVSSCYVLIASMGAVMRVSIFLNLAIWLGVDLNLLFDPVHWLRLRVRKTGGPGHPPATGQNHHEAEN